MCSPSDDAPSDNAPVQLTRTDPYGRQGEQTNKGKACETCRQGCRQVWHGVLGTVYVRRTLRHDAESASPTPSLPVLIQAGLEHSTEGLCPTRLWRFKAGVYLRVAAAERAQDWKDERPFVVRARARVGTHHGIRGGTGMTKPCHCECDAAASFSTATPRQACSGTRYLCSVLHRHFRAVQHPGSVFPPCSRPRSSSAHLALRYFSLHSRRGSADERHQPKQGAF
jgi:hypothetical protein